LLQAGIQLDQVIDCLAAEDSFDESPLVVHWRQWDEHVDLVVERLVLEELVREGIKVGVDLFRRQIQSRRSEVVRGVFSSRHGSQCPEGFVTGLPEHASAATT